ncbi:hypothetical protein ACF0H5_003994 [Mactra antiquata]
MAACIQNNLDFGLDLDKYLSKEESKLSRTEQFIRNFQTNEIWKTNELSPFISKLVDKINSVDEYLRDPKTDDFRSNFNISECYGFGRDCNSSKQKLGTRNDKECRDFFDVDHILRANFPPHEHLDGTENKICNALYEDGRQEGSVWKDTVIRYNNSFDPRLAFKGLVPEKLQEQESRNSEDVRYQPLTYNCYLDILNPSAFTNSFLKNHRQYNEDLKKDKLGSYRSWKSTASSTGLYTNMGNPEPICDEDDSDIPTFVGENSEFIDMWSKISPTQMFWIREDYKWLDNSKPAVDKRAETKVSDFNPQIGQSQLVDSSYMSQTNNQPTQVFTDTRRMEASDVQDGRQTEVYPQTTLNPVPSQHINYHTYHHQAHAYPKGTTSCFTEQRPYHPVHYMIEPGTHTVDQNIQQPLWGNENTTNYQTHVNVHDDSAANHLNRVHQFPLRYFPMVPELTTSMFWSHQKREYQNKHNTSLHNVSQDVSRQTTIESHENVPIPYERNGQRCDEPTSLSNQSSGSNQTQYCQPMTTTGTGNLEHVDHLKNGLSHTSGYNQYDHHAMGANGYHSYPKLSNNNHRSVSGRRRTNAYRELVQKHTENIPMTDYHTQDEVIDAPTLENRLVNVDSLQGLGQDLKFDDEVWYINGVPHQHAKPLCPQNPPNIQYVVDVAPDGWSDNQVWSTGPTPDTKTRFTECHIDGRSNHSTGIPSHPEITNSASLLPRPSMQLVNTGIPPYIEYNNINNCNAYFVNKNNNGHGSYTETDSTVIGSSKSSANTNSSSESELSPVSSLYTLSSRSQGDSSSENGTESGKESSSSDTTVSWLEISEIFKDRSSVPRQPICTNKFTTKGPCEYDPCDSSDSNTATKNEKDKHRKGESHRPRRTNCCDGKQIKVLSRRRSPVSTQKKKQKLHQRNIKTSTNTCLIKIV